MIEFLNYIFSSGTIFFGTLFMMFVFAACIKTALSGFRLFEINYKITSEEKSKNIESTLSSLIDVWRKKKGDSGDVKK